MQTDLGLNYLSPTQPVGMAILVVGIFFSFSIFYILFNLDKDSASDKKRKADEAAEKVRKIQRLYPSKLRND